MWLRRRKRSICEKGSKSNVPSLDERGSEVPTGSYERARAPRGSRGRSVALLHLIRHFLAHESLLRGNLPPYQPLLGIDTCTSHI